MVTVQVPLMTDKPEWNLNGQTIAFTFSPQETVSTFITHLIINHDDTHRCKINLPILLKVVYL